MHICTKFLSCFKYKVGVVILYNNKELCISIPHNQIQICRISGKQIIPFNQFEQLKTPCAFSARQSRSLNGHRRAESQEMKRLPYNAAYVSTTSKVFNTIAKMTKYKPAETTKNHKATAPSHAVVRGTKATTRHHRGYQLPHFVVNDHQGDLQNLYKVAQCRIQHSQDPFQGKGGAPTQELKKGLQGVQGVQGVQKLR